MFVKFKNLEGVFKDLIPYQKRIKSLYRKIVELGYTGTEEEFVNFIYSEVTANLGKQDIKDKFEEIEDEIEKTIGNINKLGLNVLQKDNKTEYTPTENYNPATKKYVDDKIPRKLSEFENDLPNADWNQNDESQIDYIKNRPFYESVEQVICIPEQMVNFAEGKRSAIIQFDNRIEDGYVCDVEFDGILYTNIVAYESSGDMSIYLNFATESGHQISICDTASLFVPSELAGTSHTIKVISHVENLVKMDNKYLPNDLIIGDSVTIGNRNYDKEIGFCSASIGQCNEASDWYCFALGTDIKTTGKYSYGEGFNIISRGISSRPQHVQGKYNIEDNENKYAHIVGNGNYSTRSNAHTLDWNGNAWYAGNVYTGGTGQDDANAKKLATEEYVNNIAEEVTKPKDYFILKDSINKYNYVIQMQNGSLVSFIKAASIKVTTPPAKTDYTDTEEFDTTGMVVVAVGEDGSEREITDCTYEKYVTTESDTHIIKYTEAGTEYTTEISIVTRTIEEALIDFNYTANSDGTYTITGWKGTHNGVTSTEMIFPNSELVIL